MAVFTSAGLTPVALSAAALKSMLLFGSDFDIENGSWAGWAGGAAAGIVSGAGGGAARGREGAARRGEREGFLTCEERECVRGSQAGRSVGDDGGDRLVSNPSSLTSTSGSSSRCTKLANDRGAGATSTGATGTGAGAAGVES